MNSFVCFDGCPFILDATCVQYTGPDLDNLFNIDSPATLEEILQAIDNITFNETLFSANSNNSIYAVAGGVQGHSPTYNVRLNPQNSNLLVTSTQGLSASLSLGGDGKVKVDSDDDKDYLEDQFGIADDDIVIMTVTPTKVLGRIQFVPSLDIPGFISEIRDNYHDEFCDIIDDCIPHKAKSFTTTTTTTIP